MTKKTKILYLGNKLSTHGFTPTAIELLGPGLEREGYSIVYASDKRSKVWRLADITTAIIKHRKHIDVVLIDTYSTPAFYFAWTAAYICRQLNIPYIPILHGGNMPIRMRSSPRLCAQLFGGSYINIAVSGYLLKELEQRNYRSMLIPNAIDIVNYPFKQRSSLQPKLLWVRSFHSVYNPAMAVIVLRQLQAIYPDATLTMVGPDKDGSLEKCRSLSEELGLQGSVQFTGKLTRDEWVKLSGGYDIFLNTSTIDNLPFSIIEAMALGLPVVSTNVGGIPFLVSNKVGILVENNDVQGMTNAIVNMVSGDAKELSFAARQTAEQYNWNIVKLKWIDLLDNV